LDWLIEHVPLVHNYSRGSTLYEHSMARKQSCTPRLGAADAYAGTALSTQHLPVQVHEEVERSIHKSTFKKMSVVGQFNLGFIVTKLEGDLFIVDQHASDEIRNFEELRKNTVLRNQKLIHPLPLELSAAEEALVCENRIVFERNGFNLDIAVGDEDANDVNLPPVGRRIHVVSLPYSQNTMFDVGDAMELISQLVHFRDEGTHDFSGVSARSIEDISPSKFRAMLASRACRSSIMIGTALEKVKMKQIVQNLSTLDRPWNCPHGRPTMRHLSKIPFYEPGKMYW